MCPVSVFPRVPFTGLQKPSTNSHSAIYTNHPRSTHSEQQHSIKHSIILPISTDVHGQTQQWTLTTSFPALSSRHLSTSTRSSKPQPPDQIRHVVPQQFVWLTEVSG